MKGGTGGKAIKSFKMKPDSGAGMRRVDLGHAARWEYFRVIHGRYSKAEGKAKGGMLDEFCLNTGYHRKYAIRLLNGPPPGKHVEAQPRGRKPRYGASVVSLLAAVWEAAGYPWSVRLKALLPSWMPWIRQRFKLSAETEKQLLGISARQIDRRLQAKKTQRKRRLYGRTRPGRLLKHHIPVKTDSWDVTRPGFAEMPLSRTKTQFQFKTGEESRISSI